MASMELVPLSPDEQYRDYVEQQLAAEANKREINRRSSDGITVIAYWLMKENICLIFVHDARTNDASEFVVPNDEVGEWFLHPFANKNVQMNRYEQRENHEGV